MRNVEVKYVPEFNGNRNLAEEAQCYALITPTSASTQNKAITNEIINRNLAGNKNAKFDYAGASLEINRKHCPKVYNILDPLTDEIYPELKIEEIFEMGSLKELYEEISQAVGDISKLKEGLKKK